MIIFTMGVKGLQGHKDFGDCLQNQKSDKTVQQALASCSDQASTKFRFTKRLAGGLTDGTKAMDFPLPDSSAETPSSEGCSVDTCVPTTPSTCPISCVEGKIEKTVQYPLRTYHQANDEVEFTWVSVAKITWETVNDFMYAQGTYTISQHSFEKFGFIGTLDTSSGSGTGYYWGLIQIKLSQPVVLDDETVEQSFSGYTGSPAVPTAACNSGTVLDVASTGDYSPMNSDAYPNHNNDYELYYKQYANWAEYKYTWKCMCRYGTWKSAASYLQEGALPSPIQYHYWPQIGSEEKCAWALQQVAWKYPIELKGNYASGKISDEY